MNKRALPPFTSEMTKRECIMALAYIPFHVLLLPLLFTWSVYAQLMDEVTANVLCYAIGFIYMLIFELRFLRRDFDPLCDHPLRCVLEIIAGYLLMMVCNYCVSIILLLVIPDASNPNNGTIMDMAKIDMRWIKVMTVFFAPPVEELMFRAGIFGTLRRSNRFAAYAVSALVFSLYHVWSFAITDPINWIYIIQYIPVSLLLARCYERTNSIWCSIFFHMTVNAVSLQALSMLQDLL
jgi:uncharacterized protein